MRRHTYLFPDGLPGLGLILLRIALSVGLWPVPRQMTILLGDLASFGLSGVLFIAFMAGGLTSIAALACLILHLTALLLHQGPIVELSLMSIVVCVAVVMLGPGAYSLDSLLYGRKVHCTNPPPRKTPHG